MESGRAVGISIFRKSGDNVIIRADNIISDAGLYNTFHSLLPPQIASKSRYYEVLNSMKQSVSAMNVFIGLNASAEELGLKTHNTWAYANHDSVFEDYCGKDVEDALDAEVPFIFISFPNTKDPQWAAVPGNKDKSMCALVTMASYEWFQKYDANMIKRRGDEYEGLKNTIGHQMIDQLCKVYPQVKDHIDYTNIGSPVTCKHYLGSPLGDFYGLHHGTDRFTASMTATLRCQTDVPGLYLTGQDTLSTGFMASSYSGLMCASAILGKQVHYHFDNFWRKTVKELKQTQKKLT